MKYHHLLYDINKLHRGLEDGGKRTMEALINPGWITWILEKAGIVYRPNKV